MAAQLTLVKAHDVAPPAEASATLNADQKTARLLADLDRASSDDRELGARAARCIRELIQQKEQAIALMLESSALLREALQRLHAVRGMI